MERIRMIAESKLVLLPVIGIGIVLANLIEGLPDTIRVVLDLAALAILFAGFLVVGRLRAESSAAKGAAEAWERERNAERAKADRLEHELSTAQSQIAELRVEMSRLEARPTLDVVQAQLDQIRQMMTQTAEAVQTVVQSQRPQEAG